MKPSFEFIAFATVAILAHLAVLAIYRDSNTDLMSAGSGGEAEITLHAVAGDVNAVIGQWMAPPEISAAVDDIVPPNTTALRNVLRPVDPQVSNPMPVPLPIVGAPSKTRAPIVETESYTRPKQPAAAERGLQPKPKTL